jgi:arylsulfatase A-like enzyme
MSIDDMNMRSSSASMLQRRALHQRYFPQPSPVIEPRRAGLEVFASGLWFGVVTGLIELVILLIWQEVGETNALGDLQINRHFLWMIPVGHVGVFSLVSLPGSLAAACGSIYCRRLSRMAQLWFCGFSLLIMIPGIYAIAAAVLAAGMAYRLERRLAGYSLQFATLIRRTMPGLIAITAMLAAYCFDREILLERRTTAALPAISADSPNVLLIVLDTVAATHMSLHGYDRPTTPNLDSLAKRGVWFQEARAPSPWTLPSHATILTGEWPRKLGVGVDQPLDETTPTLAEILRERGYATSGFIANTYFCNSWFGLNRGFIHYEDDYDSSALVSPIETLRCTAIGRFLLRNFGGNLGLRPETINIRKSADKINQDFLAWLDLQRGRPFFTFLNYFDTHDPYLPAPGHERRHGPGPTGPDDHELLQTWNKQIQNCGRTAQHDATERDIALIRDSYDECLTYLDDRLGALFRELERRGLLKNTLVVVTADHGEAFGEHGYFGHSMTLHREEVHVPLIMVSPNHNIPAGLKISQPVSLRDIAATVLDLLDESGGASLPGSTMAHLWNDSPDSNQAEISPVLSTVEIAPKGFVESPIRGRAPALCGPMESIVLDGHTYVRDVFGREQLFRIQNDADEQQNLADDADSVRVLRRCRAALDAALR